MSPTLLEFVVAVAVIVVAWQIGLVIAPEVIRLIRGMKREVDEVAEEALRDPPASQHSYQEEHTNGSRR